MGYLIFFAVIILAGIAFFAISRGKVWEGLALCVFLGFFIYYPVDSGPTLCQYCVTPSLWSFKPYLTVYGQLGTQAGAGRGWGVFAVNQRKGPHHVFVIKQVMGRGVGRYVIDPLYFYFPKRMRALLPDEADIIVKTRYYETEVGKYTDRAKGYRRCAEVVVVDKKTGQIVGSNVIEGSDPPTTKYGHANERGSSPDREIVDYVVYLLGG